MSAISRSLTCAVAVAVAVALVLAGGAAGAASPAAADPAVRARDVLAAARRSLGGEAALAAVRALTLEGELRRRMPDAEGGGAEEMTGSVRVDTLGPDRYLRVDTLSPMPGMPGIPVASGLDGEEAWAAALPVASSPHVVMRIAPPGDAGAQSRTKERIQRESALFLIATLLGGGGTGTEFTWVAEAEAPEGRADVLQVTGRGGLEARLFIDQKTHRPLMVTFRESAPRLVVRRMGPDGPRGHAAEAAPPSPPPPSEATLFLSEWKTVGGLLLPHALNKSLDGKPYEEIVVSRYVIDDPGLTADKFRKKR
jgi:hypothetical protein